MTERSTTDSPALQVALVYHSAWTRKDVDEALRHVADDIVCDAPSGELRGIAAYRPFLEGFVPTVTGYDMIAALGDQETAVLVYDLRTLVVPSALVCECFTIRAGKIARSRLIFDQTPYAAARQKSV